MEMEKKTHNYETNQNAQSYLSILVPTYIIDMCFTSNKQTTDSW